MSRLISKYISDYHPTNKIKNYKSAYQVLNKLRMDSGYYIQYLYDRLPKNMDYDIVVANLYSDVFNIRSIGRRTDPYLVINISFINKYLETQNIDYLDAIIYRLRYRGDNKSPDDLVKEMKEHRKLLNKNAN